MYINPARTSKSTSLTDIISVNNSLFDMHYSGSCLYLNLCLYCILCKLVYYTLSVLMSDYVLSFFICTAFVYSIAPLKRRNK
jgi:hypothetical protein